MRTVTALMTAAMLLTTAGLHAADVTITENFETDAASWENPTFSPLTHVPAAGPSADGYVSTDYAFGDLPDGAFGLVLFRGESFNGASDGEFAGNYIADGVKQFKALVRHNAPLPLVYNVRFASPFNFPGSSAILLPPVMPNTWTELEVSIRPGNSEFVTFEGTNFNTVFSDIGNLQIGVSVPAAFADSPTPFTYDLDFVSISTVPEPATVGLVMLALAGLVGRRSRK
ncbi:PEP-CTERM sorting domain-containing protein [Pseudobythopirellula maris]|nr:PEP-CTERM sorting domain-containing protein [Pseudobythopirellula maris]